MEFLISLGIEGRKHQGGSTREEANGKEAAVRKHLGREHQRGSFMGKL
jgi:hypothetical protein